MVFLRVIVPVEQQEAPQGLKPLQHMQFSDGRYWTRTSDPYDVSVVLYQLS